jgi:chromate transport protein ChrA
MKKKKDVRDNWMIFTACWLIILGAIAIASSFGDLPNAKSLVEILDVIVPTIIGIVFWVLGYVIGAREMLKPKAKRGKRK